MQTLVKESLIFISTIAVGSLSWKKAGLKKKNEKRMPFQCSTRNKNTK
jgi:hypothetical protein